MGIHVEDGDNERREMWVNGGGGDGEDRMRIWMGRPSVLARFHLPRKGIGTGGQEVENEKLGQVNTTIPNKNMTFQNFVF
jgi:hypothetical protein